MFLWWQGEKSSLVENHWARVTAIPTTVDEQFPKVSLGSYEWGEQASYVERVLDRELVEKVVSVFINVNSNTKGIIGYSNELGFYSKNR